VANVVADALSRIAYTQPSTKDESLLNTVELRISASEEWLQDIRNEYRQDVVFGDILEHLQGSAAKEGNQPVDTKKSRRIRERAKGYLLRDGLLFHRASGEKL